MATAPGTRAERPTLPFAATVVAVVTCLASACQLLAGFPDRPSADADAEADSDVDADGDRDVDGDPDGDGDPDRDADAEMDGCVPHCEGDATVACSSFSDVTTCTSTAGCSFTATSCHTRVGLEVSCDFGNAAHCERCGCYYYEFTCGHPGPGLPACSTIEFEDCEFCGCTLSGACVGTAACPDATIEAGCVAASCTWDDCTDGTKRAP
jgi:hypothetical protein